jgi:hypothetical protein
MACQKRQPKPAQEKGNEMSFTGPVRRRSRNSGEFAADPSALFLRAIATEISKVRGNNDAAPLADARQLLAQAFHQFDQLQAFRPKAA